MIRIKNKILQCLNNFDIKEPAHFFPLLGIQNYIKKNVKIVKREINYLKQRGLVEEKIINFVPSYRITAEGIDSIYDNFLRGNSLMCSLSVLIRQVKA